jgi:LysR family transcriptional activator of nhaA
VIERHRQELELVCQEGSYADLLGRVGSGELDMVLSDSPVPPSLARSLHARAITETGVSFMAAPSLAARLKGAFPRNLDHAPLLASSSGASALMQSLESWFTRLQVRPHIVGRIDDSALLKGLAQGGFGVAAVPTSIEAEVSRQYRMKVLGRVPELRMPIYLVRARGRRPHPLVAEIEQA